ncbi:hypothetical protein FD754_005516, partial [Muntiacus muntjak]
RRKQKWAVDPRNTAWSNDDSKFGQRMLEKMGWSKGKGLGAQEQGATDHIKVQVKNNHLGLGATINNEDHPSPSATEETDTSRTTTSAFTIHEYFARRMAERKSKAQGVAAVPEASETPVERKGRKKRKKEAKDKNADNDIQPKAKKKRNQVECELGDPRWDENPGASAGAGEGRVGPLDEQDSPPKPKKRREKEKGPEQVEAAVGSTLDETLVKRKKKKKGSK